MKEIIMTRGLFALVDDMDFESLMNFKWYPHYIRKSNLVYCYRSTCKNNKTTPIYIHRQILGLSDSRIYVDHIDGNGLNNQRSNLRICNQSENIRNSKLSSKNTSGFKGVYYHKPAGKFMAYIRHNYKMYNLGLYRTAEEAADSRNRKAKELHGEFAVLNQV